MKFDYMRAKHQMLDLHMTQRKLASLIGVNLHTVNMWMIGRMQPTLSNLGKIADALGLDYSELLKREEV